MEIRTSDMKRLFVLALVLAAVPEVWGVTIVGTSTGGANISSGATISFTYTTGFSWTQTQYYNNVTINLLLGNGTGPITAYLTTKVGAGTDASSLVAQATFTPPAAVPFHSPFTLQSIFPNLLSLGPGTYYLTLLSSAGAGAGWYGVSPAATQTTLDTGASLGPVQFSSSLNQSFPPASTFFVDSTLSPVLQVSGDPAAAPPLYISGLSPNSTTAGSPGFTLFVTGSGFFNTSVVQWGGVPLTTTYVSANQLTASVPGNLVASAGIASVLVTNPGGATSNVGAFTVNPPLGGALAILTPSTLPSGANGVFYSQALAAGGGATPYFWSFISGTLPSGLSFTSSGAVTGTPTAVGTYSFVARVTDAASASATATFSLTITGSLTITTNPTLPVGSIGTLYAQTLAASGGVAPYSWSLVSGAFPPGLSLASTGAITGTPTAAGTLSFTVRVTDAASSSATQNFSLTISTSPAFTSALRVPQIVDGAGWKTRFAIINTDQVPVTFTFQFWGDDGSALAFPILNGTPGVVTATLAPGASFFAQSPGTSSTLLQGWAEVASSGRIGVTAIFQYSTGSPRDSVGSAIATLSASSLLMPFDNTQGNATAVAIANTNPTQSITVSMLFETDGGAQSTASIVLPPHTHQAFLLPAINQAVAGVRGSVQFTAASADVAAVGLEFTPAGQFTSLGTFQ